MSISDVQDSIFLFHDNSPAIIILFNETYSGLVSNFVRVAINNFLISIKDIFECTKREHSKAPLGRSSQKGLLTMFVRS